MLPIDLRGEDVEQMLPLTVRKKNFHTYAAQVRVHVVCRSMISNEKLRSIFRLIERLEQHKINCVRVFMSMIFIHSNMCDTCSFCQLFPFAIICTCKIV